MLIGRFHYLETPNDRFSKGFLYGTTLGQILRPSHVFSVDGRQKDLLTDSIKFDQIGVA